MTARSAGYAIALDVGGTFTDVALVHEAERPPVGHQDADDAR